MTPPPPPLQQSDGHPLSHDDFINLEQANKRVQKIRKAASVAAFNGYTFGILAAISALFVVASVIMKDIDYLSTIITAALIVLSYNELKGRRLLLDFDLRAPKLLGWNQVGVIVLITIYCVYQIYVVYSGNSALDRELRANPQIRQFFGLNLTKMERQFALVFYGTVIVVSLIVQGLNSIYYFTRKKVLSEYMAKTPGWVIEVQRRTAKQ